MSTAKPTKSEAATKGSGKRRRWGGKMGLRRKVSGKWVVIMRSATHGGHSPAFAGYECDSTRYGKGAVQTKLLPGQYKVAAPTKRHHRRGIVRNVS